MLELMCVCAAAYLFTAPFDMLCGLLMEPFEQRGRWGRLFKLTPLWKLEGGHFLRCVIKKLFALLQLAERFCPSGDCDGGVEVSSGG